MDKDWDKIVLLASARPGGCNNTKYTPSEGNGSLSRTQSHLLWLSIHWHCCWGYNTSSEHNTERVFFLARHGATSQTAPCAIDHYWWWWMVVVGFSSSSSVRSSLHLLFIYASEATQPPPPNTKRHTSASLARSRAPFYFHRVP